jgi:hypothetical protein
MASAPAFGNRGDLGGKPQRQDDQGFAPVAADDQQVGAIEPVIEPAETIASDLDLDAAIDAEQRHADVTAEAAPDGAGKRDTFGGKPALLQIANQGPLGAIAFLA